MLPSGMKNLDLSQESQSELFTQLGRYSMRQSKVLSPLVSSKKTRGDTLLSLETCFAICVSVTSHLNSLPET